MNVSTIEEGGSDTDSGENEQVTATSTAGGPSITVSFSDGSTVTLGSEDLQLYLAVIQTLVLLYWVHQEVTTS